MEKNRVKIGIIGCGGISNDYSKVLKESGIVEIVSCADRIPEKAKKLAEKYKIPKSSAVDEMLSNPEIEIIVNLTTPDAHYEINTVALEAGKHVYTEKPVAVTIEKAEDVFALARKKGLRVAAEGSVLSFCIVLQLIRKSAKLKTIADQIGDFLQAVFFIVLSPGKNHIRFDRRMNEDQIGRIRI